RAKFDTRCPRLRSIGSLDCESVGPARAVGPGSRPIPSARASTTVIERLESEARNIPSPWGEPASPLVRRVDFHNLVRAPDGFGPEGPKVIEPANSRQPDRASLLILMAEGSAEQARIREGGLPGCRGFVPEGNELG